MNLLLALLFWFYLIQATFCCVFLELSNGMIKGRLGNIPMNKKTFYSFQQIPYAAPPVGNLRFQPPQPVSDWVGILDATHNTKICYQMTSDSDNEDEDCLYLNVYTPDLPSKTKNAVLPVMVYIHGGGFVIGDSTYQSFGPEFVIDRDVVVVTLNYRLGVFGFLSTQDEVLPGNNGLKDQLLALQWINTNIHIFGGNSSEITIFGQSAGAASVGYHLISRKSQGLFRAAIMESGSPLSPWSYQRNAKTYAYKIASLINPFITEDNSSNEILDVMLSVSAKDIDVASNTIAGQETYDNAQIFQGYYYAPVIEPESDEAFLTEKMYEVILRGDANKVPLIMGINSEESLSQTTNLNFLKRLMAKFDDDLKALVPNDMNINSESTKTEAGGHIRELYSGDQLLQDVPAAGVKYMSDTSFTRPVIKHASIQSKYSNVYFYQFSYDGKMGNVTIIVEGRKKKLFCNITCFSTGTERVGHNEENAYFWRIRNSMFDNYDLSIYPDGDITTQNRLIRMWTDFAKTLNPTPEQIDLLQSLIWPTVCEDFAYLDIDNNLQIRHYPKEISFNRWNAIYEEFGVEPYDTF